MDTVKKRKLILKQEVSGNEIYELLIGYLIHKNENKQKIQALIQRTGEKFHTTVELKNECADGVYLRKLNAIVEIFIDED